MKLSLSVDENKTILPQAGELAEQRELSQADSTERNRSSSSPVGDSQGDRLNWAERDQAENWKQPRDEASQHIHIHHVQ